MANRFEVLHNRRRLALAYVSPHPDYKGHIIVSVIPLERKGKWEDSTLEIRLESPVHDIFPETKNELEAVAEVIGQAKIEPWKVEISPVNAW